MSRIIGQLLRIVRERYLRDDIPCHFAECKSCVNGAKILNFSLENLIVLDIGIAIDFLEIFESFPVKGIVLAQTIIDVIQDELVGLNRRSLIRRLRAITEDPRRQTIVFSNENNVHTFLELEKHDSRRRRHGNAIIKLADYFRLHLLQIASSFPTARIPRVILISNNQDILNQKTELQMKGIIAQTLEDFLKANIMNALELYNSISQMIQDKRIDSSSSARKKLNSNEYSEYMTDDALESGLKSGTLFKGKLQINQWNHSEAIVWLSSSSSPAISKNAPKQVFISNLKLQNRAINGDTVYVSFLPREEWVKPSGMLSSNKIGNINSREGSKSLSEEPLIPNGKVVGIQKQSRRQFVCTMKHNQAAMSSLSYSWQVAVPWDRNIPRIRFKTRQYTELENCRILLKIDEWPSNSEYPHGHYVKNLGPIGNHETEIQVLLNECEVDSSPFAQALLDEIPPSVFNSVTTGKKEWNAMMDLDSSQTKRRDITDWRIYSIDPLGCQDIDDALSCRKLENGNLQIGVHIADVCAFVKDGSLIDMEARARATSVYLVDRRIDMIPTVLSERICSLRERQSRFAVSVIWEFEYATGKILDTWYGRTLIKTAHEMYYGDAQDVLDEKDSSKLKFNEEFPLLLQELTEMRRIYRIVRKERYLKGALDLGGLESEFKLDKVSNPVELFSKTPLEIHKLVEEFMILANISVANFIYENKKECSLLRRHPLPRDQNFFELLQLAKSAGFEIDTSSNLALAKSLHYATTHSTDASIGLMLKMMTTRAMEEAKYFSTGSFNSIDDFYHYGLAADFYTHFTSPIRRYADIVVHRQLLSILNGKEVQPNPPSTKSDVFVSESLEIQKIADHLNTKNANAKFVQRQSREVYQSLFFMNQSPLAEEIAVVTGIKNGRCGIFLPKFSISSNIVWMKEGKLVAKVAEQACSRVIPTAGPICIKSVETHVSSNKQQFMTTNGTFDLEVFDRLRVRIGVVTSKTHMNKLEFEVLEFIPQGTQAPPVERQDVQALNSKPTSSSHSEGFKALVRQVQDMNNPSFSLRATEGLNSSHLYSILISFNFPSIDTHRALASLFLTSLWVKRKSKPLSLSKRIKSVSISSPKHISSNGRRIWKETEYRKALEERANEAYFEYEEETKDAGPSTKPSNPSIPGAQFGPIAAFGSTIQSKAQSNLKLAKAVASAEQQFRSDQAKVNKSKYESRHYK